MEEVNGGYSSLPSVFVYLNMNGEILVPKPVPGREKEFSQIFNDSFGKKAR